MKKLLVIEDNLENIRNAEQAFCKTFNVIFALDLEQAMKEIDKKPDFVVTDMAFHQHGFSVELLQRIKGERDIETPTQYLDIEVGEWEIPRGERFALSETKSAVKEAVVKSTIFRDGEFQHALIGSTDTHLRNKIVDDASANEYYPGHNTKDAGLVEYAKVPALGYFVIKKCREMGIPVVFLSHMRHATHVIPAMAAGFETEIPQPNERAQREKDLETKNGIFVWDYTKTPIDYWRTLYKLFV